VNVESQNKPRKSWWKSVVALLFVASFVLSIAYGQVDKNGPIRIKWINDIVVNYGPAGCVVFGIGVLLVIWLGFRDAKLAELRSGRPPVVAASHGMSTREWFAITAIAAGAVTAVRDWMAWMRNEPMGISIVIGPIVFMLACVAYRRCRLSRVGEKCRQCTKTFVPTKVTISGVAPICSKCKEALKNTGPRFSETGCKTILVYFCLAIILLVVIRALSLGGLNWLWLLAIPIVGVGLWLLYRRHQLRVINNVSYSIWYSRLMTFQRGSICRFGSVQVWSAKRAVPTSELERHFNMVRECYEKWFGPWKPGKPLSILNFATRDQCVRISAVYLTDFCYLYFNGETAVIMVYGADNHENFEEPELVFPQVISWYLMNHVPHNLLTKWIEIAISHAISIATVGNIEKRLAHRISLAVAKNELLGVHDWLRLSHEQLAERCRTVDSPTDINYVFYSQSCSLGDYLLGHGATNERREKTKQFFLDPEPKTEKTEEIFTRHFGYGYDQLWAEWRVWLDTQIEAQRDVPPKMPSPEHREKIENYFLPIIRDPHAPHEKRLLLVRRLGGAGYLLGADVLIDLLAQTAPPPVTTSELPIALSKNGLPTVVPSAAKPVALSPSEELYRACIGALELISGRPLGDDLTGWKTWWAEVEQSG
jgi:hypothetical protein